MPIDIETLLQAVEHHDTIGYCVVCCVEVSEDVEPDETKGLCSECGLNTVYGVEKLLQVRLGLW